MENREITVFSMIQHGKLVELVVASKFLLKDVKMIKDGKEVYPNLWLMHKADYINGAKGIQNIYGPHSEKALIEFGYKKEIQKL